MFQSRFSLDEMEAHITPAIDLGADKFSNVTGGLSPERNPFLGLRSIRLCLRKLDLFKTQLRAILRAALLGDVRVMFPMISTVDELRQCKTLLNEVKEDLEDAGIPFKSDRSNILLAKRVLLDCHNSRVMHSRSRFNLLSFFSRRSP